MMIEIGKDYSRSEIITKLQNQKNLIIRELRQDMPPERRKCLYDYLAEVIRVLIISQAVLKGGNGDEE